MNSSGVPAATLTATALGLFRRWPTLEGSPSDRWRHLAGEYRGPTDVGAFRAHKLLAAYVHLMAAGDRVDPTLINERERQIRRAAVLSDEMRLVSGRLEASDIRYAVLRGPAIARRYPAGWPREANDIDVLLPDAAELRRALTALAGLGYYLARPVVCRRDHAAGGVWAAAALNRLRPDLEHPMYLDLAVGGPAIDRTRCLPVPARAWRNRQNVAVGDTTVPVFPVTDLVALFMVELMERAEPIARDLLDFAALSRQEVDWDAVREMVRRYRIAPGARSLSALARAADQPALADQLEWLCAGAAGQRATWRTRTLARTDRLYRYGMRRRPMLTLAVVERTPVGPFFAMGLPAYVYPPRADGRPLRGGAGAAAADIPGHRARVQAVAAAEEVEEIFEQPAARRQDVSLTAVEMDWWRDALCTQIIGGAGEEPSEARHVRSFVETAIVADGGTSGTLAVRQDGVVTAACRAANSLHPVTLVKDLLIEGLCAGPGREPDVVELFDHVPPDVETRVELPTNGPGAMLEEPLRRLGFQPEVLTVRRPTADLEPPADWRIRLATERDQDFVYHCLAIAVERGLFGREPRVDVEAWVRDRFPAPAGEHVTCVVADSEDGLLGHGYAVLRPDRYRSGSCGYVVDVLVVPSAQGRGGSRALTAALGAALCASGVTVLESEVAFGRGGVDPTPLRTSLASAGWRGDRMRWVRHAHN